MGANFGSQLSAFKLQIELGITPYFTSQALLYNSFLNANEATKKRSIAFSDAFWRAARLAIFISANTGSGALHPASRFARSPYRRVRLAARIAPAGHIASRPAPAKRSHIIYLQKNAAFDGRWIQLLPAEDPIITHPTHRAWGSDVFPGRAMWPVFLKHR